MDRGHVAFLGIGAMGRAMAGRLLAAGMPLVVWNRTRERAAGLVERGAQLADTPADAARGAAVVLTMLSDPGAVESVVLGPAGALAGIAPGALVADLSTVGPALARRLDGELRARGGRFVDAPVYGSVRPAEEGALVILAGGQAEDVAALAPILGVLGKRTFHVGPVGSGQELKLAINATGGHVLTGIATGLALVQAQGLDGAMYLEALAAGAFGSPLVGLKGPMMLARDYAPAFTVALTLKDLRLARERALEGGVSTTSLDALVKLFERASEAGLGDRDLSAVHEVLRANRPQ